MRRRYRAALAVGIAGAALIAYKVHPSNAPAVTQHETSLTQLLAQVHVVDHRPNIPGYQRGCDVGQACSFGPAWTDNSDAPSAHNGCDTRDDMLAASLTYIIRKAGSACVITAGILDDPYTGRTVSFIRGKTSTAVQIDHVYPLKAAWDLGASRWTQARRTAFANDTARELLAVSGPANLAKGDSTLAFWLPPNRGFQCAYVRRYLAVAVTYGLPITVADKARIALTCTSA